MELGRHKLIIAMSKSSDLGIKKMLTGFPGLRNNDLRVDVTSFLGIPVDGARKDMIDNIKRKGFSTIRFGGKRMLKGLFNGSDVYIDLHIRSGKVFRVAVFDVTPSDGHIILSRYNELCRYFGNSPEYMSLSDDSISEDEDIEHEISINKKEYQAVFYQAPYEDKVGWCTIRAMILKKISGDLDRLTETELRSEFDRTYAINKLKAMCRKPVWFTIVEDTNGLYRIAIFYENVDNSIDTESQI